jgi:WhiB family transcriptional regulator, redox-sensing transcriptional regulator
VTSRNERWLVDIAWRLDRLRWVPRDVLNEIVLRNGQCVWMCLDGNPPDLADAGDPDRELATRLCGGCPVKDECLELELRSSGNRTVGVWGGMSEQDRQTLHPHWLQRGERAEPLADDDQSGGGQ